MNTTTGHKNITNRQEDDKIQIERLKKQLEVTERKLINAKHRSDAHEQFAKEAHEREIAAKKIAIECKRNLKLTLDKYQSIEYSIQITKLQTSCLKNRTDISKTEKLIREICADPNLHLPINNAKRLKHRKLTSKLERLRSKQLRQTQLLNHFYSQNELNDSMRSAAVNNDVTEIKRLLSHGPHGVSVNVPDQMGLSAFMYACGNGHMDTLDIMIESADIHSKGCKPSCKPLILATRSLQEKAIALLLDHGANIEEQDEVGQTPLMIACGNVGNYECASMLIKRGANVNAADKQGNTALHHCAKHNHCLIVELLLENNANVKLENAESLTARAVGISCRHDEFVAMMRGYVT